MPNSTYRPPRPEASPETHQRLKELGEWLETHQRGRWLIVPHNNPDPDALAAALIMAKILRQRFRQRVTIAYAGLIGRAENQAMVRLLKIPLSRMRHINWKNYRHIALVDCQPHTGNTTLPDDLVPDLVIDHHPLRRQTRDVPLHDLREGYGATATIAAEYLLASGLTVTRREATALVYAQRTETLDFSREFPGPDRPIYDYFLSLADKRILGKIRNPRLPEDYYRTLHEALERVQGVDTLIISALGVVPQPDIVPEIADLLLRMDGRTWSMCSGRFDDRLYVSIRTTNPRADAGRLMQRLLGRKGLGGGHGMLAGGWYPVADTDEAEKVQQRFAKRLAKLLRKNPERLAPLDFGGRAPDVPPEA